MHQGKSEYGTGSEDPREAANPGDLRDLDSIVKHLDQDIGAYLKLGVSSNLQLTSEQLLQVIEWAKMVNREEEVFPPETTEVDFFMSGLLEEIVQIPYNVFEEVEFPDGKTRYMPVRPEVWEAGLERFEAKFLTTLKKKDIKSEDPVDDSYFQLN
ncbi:MAG: hypothetical protein AAF571_09410 [Verrucomicrobiota bacterium]